MVLSVAKGKKAKNPKKGKKGKKGKDKKKQVEEKHNDPTPGGDRRRAKRNLDSKVVGAAAGNAKRRIAAAGAGVAAKPQEEESDDVQVDENEVEFVLSRSTEPDKLRDRLEKLRQKIKGLSREVAAEDAAAFEEAARHDAATKKFDDLDGAFRRETLEREEARREAELLRLRREAEAKKAMKRAVQKELKRLDERAKRDATERTAGGQPAEGAGGSEYTSFEGFEAGRAAGDDPEPDESSEGDESEDSEKQQVKEVDWNDGPDKLLPRDFVMSQASSPGAFVEHFVRYMVRAWRRELERESPFAGCNTSAAERAALGTWESFRLAQAALAPLILQLEEGAADALIVKQLDKLVTLAAEREYMDAGVVYIEISMGNKKWNNAHANYAGTHCQNKGVRVYVTKKDKEIAYDVDPVVQKYVQNMRRLLHFAQCIRPNSDVSKHLRT